MQLSVSTTSPDPSLAALLLGNAAAAALTPDGAAPASAPAGDGFAQMLAEATPVALEGSPVAVTMPPGVPTPVTAPAVWPFVAVRAAPVESLRSPLQPTEEPVVMTVDIEGEGEPVEASTETPPRVIPSRPGRVVARREEPKLSVPAAVPQVPVESFTVPLFLVFVEAPVVADEILSFPDIADEQPEEGSDTDFLSAEEVVPEVASRFDENDDAPIDPPVGSQISGNRSSRREEAGLGATAVDERQPRYLGGYPELPSVAGSAPKQLTAIAVEPPAATTTSGISAVPENGGDRLAVAASITPPLHRAAHVSRPLTSRPENHGEKFAVPAALVAPDETPRMNAPAKTFVSAAEKQLTSHLAELGTGVAKTPEAMSSVSTSARSLRASTDSVVGELTGVSLLHEVAAPTAPVESTFAPETLSAAHRAVDAVLTAAHRFSTGERHAVNLQFSVGGVDLNVRVELRADEVRTTFQTDSAELRAALSSEWHSAGAAAPDRALRLATPVFTSNDATGFSASSGDSASQQRNAQSRPATEENLMSGVRGRANRARSFETAAPAPLLPRAAVGNALHLHTLA